MSEQEASVQDVRRAISDAQNEIRAALDRLIARLPDNCLITDCEVGAVPCGVVGRGKPEYMVTADITIEIWGE